MRKQQKDFRLEDYDEFYEHHYFKPIPDQAALNLHRSVPRVAWALKVAKKLQPKKVLDLGCLEGFTALTLANHVPSIERVVGVDLSQEGIDLANSRDSLVKAETEFIRQSIEDYLAETDEKFDFITIFEVMEHVKDPELVIRLMDKVKTDDGVILISTPDFEAPNFGKDDEQNKCHIRLFTLEDEDYTGINKYGNTRKATSLSKIVGKERIIEMRTYSELINCIYK
jgi:2-polyprenyl-3-methyl-5-hydroxy-6-metoxy-1,4-benzoquinol methylase